MRLIDTRTLEVVSKRDDEIPPYAILSHTWGGDEEEVSLQDMQALFAAAKIDAAAFSTHSVVHRRGFIKIQDAAKLALSEKRDFIWVDTCCIDKTSSAELSEAINSMFRWYQKAEVCYAFLDDIDDSNPQVSPTNDAIMRSRWFTRGWTLQELIAPSVVHFYSSNWRLLGTKRPTNEPLPSTLPQSGTNHIEPTISCGGAATFLAALEKATGIDKNLLVGSLDLEEFGIAARMKWASRRQTTRVEDRAYCLMGIFGVNMPLLYGEGMNAFIRLQEAILLITDDQSIFAWKCPDCRKDQLSGLLSETPAWFEDSGHIKPLPSNIVANSAPTGITSAGLRVTMALFEPGNVTLPQGCAWPIAENIFAAVLDCSPYRSADANDRMLYKPAIMLLWLGGDQYARFNAASLLIVRAIERVQHIDTDSYRVIYVRQNPAVLSLPEIYLDDQQLLMAGYMKCLLVCVWQPEGQWDESTRTVRCKKLTSSGILCRFRYSIRHREYGRPFPTMNPTCPFPGGASKLLTYNFFSIDIFVGVNASALSYRTGPAQIWCHIQRASNDEEQRLQAMTFSRRSGLTTEHHLMGVHARMTVGSGTHAKYNNATLELRPLCIAQDIKSLSIKMQHTTVEETMVAESVDLQNHENETHHAISQLMRGLVVYDTDSFREVFYDLARTNPIAETGLHPIRSTRNPLATVDGEIGSFLGKLDPGTAGYTVRDIMKGVKLDIQHALIAKTEHVGDAMRSENKFLRFLHRRSRSDEIGNWHTFLSHKTKRPVPHGVLFSTVWRYGRRVQKVKASAESWRYPADLPSLGLNIMHYAAARNYTEGLKYLIAQDSTTGARFHKARGFLTPLHLACVLGHYQSVEVLLKDSEMQWTEVLSETSHFDHPLSLAVSFVRDQRITQLILCVKNSLSVAYSDCWIRHTQNILGETALHRAAAMNNVAGVKAIIAHLSGNTHDEIDCIDLQGRTPLWHAAAAGSHGALSLLLDQGADASSRDFCGVTVLHAACRAPLNPAELAEALLSRGADPNTYIRVDSALRNIAPILVTPCFYAAMHNGPSTLQALLKFGALSGTYPEQSSIGPLHIAAANGYLDCVKILCETGMGMDTLTPYRLQVEVSKDTEVNEAEAQRKFGKWLKAIKKRKRFSLGWGFFGASKRLSGEKRDYAAMESRLKRLVNQREVPPMIQKVSLATFTSGISMTPLDLAMAGGHGDIVAVLEKIKGH